MQDTKPILLYLLIFLLILTCVTCSIAYLTTGRYYLKKLSQYNVYHTDCIWHHPLKKTWYICLALFNMGDIQWIDAINPFSQLPLDDHRRPIDTIIASTYMTIYSLCFGVSIFYVLGLFILNVLDLIIKGQSMWHHFL